MYGSVKLNRVYIIIIKRLKDLALKVTQQIKKTISNLVPLFKVTKVFIEPGNVLSPFKRINGPKVTIIYVHNLLHSCHDAVCKV